MKDINLIRKIAWTFQVKYNVEFEELFCEASLAYCEALQSFDPLKNSKFSYYAYKRMEWRLLDFLNMENKIETVEDTYEEVPATIRTPFEELLQSLPTEVLPIVKIVTENKDRFEIMSPTSSRHEITEALRQQGWSWPVIQDTFRALKLALN